MKPEDRRLYQPGDHINRLEILVGAVQIGLGVEAELVDAYQVSAKHANDVGDQNQHRQGNQPAPPAAGSTR